MLFLLNALIYLYVFLVGSVIGSFLNVVIYRVPRGISIAKGRSFCPSCGHTLSARDLFPFFSWIFLRGKCRYCKAPISPRYPLVELLGAAAACVCYAKYGISWRTFIAFALVSVIICIAFVDLDTMEIDDRFLLVLAGLCVLFSLLSGGVGWWSRVIGFFAISLPIYLLTLLIPDCFGGGDIKFIAVCGFLLGWKLALLAGFAAIVTGGLWGIYLLLGRHEDKKAHFAFGPFLGLGVVFALFWGQPVLDAYLSLFQ